MPAPETLDHGTYELLRERVRSHGRELTARVERVNAARKAAFGGIEPELIATERISTDHSCVPRDIAAIGEVLLFGFNVQFGLKTSRSPSDVFAAYTFSENRFHPRPLDLLADPAFDKDFQDVYRYYKDASFEKFFSRGPLLYMLLRIGAGERDVKTFKWAIHEGTLRYVDNRSDHEIRLPAQYDFEWQRTRREDHVHGTHPHISIADTVFVETIGGDLTIKVENNTASGEGIFSEPVENADQTLDDADIRYARLESLVLLRIRPYQETADRHIVYCEKIRKALRIDGIGDCCRRLPADQGVIYPSGFLLHTGDGKTFDNVPAGAKFEQRIDAPNGEDFLYVFYHHAESLYILVRYNLIAQAADAPLLCHGYTLFPGGELVCFRAQPEPQRHHALQIWRTPFAAEATLGDTGCDSGLARIGNREVVAGLSECREILTLLDKEDTYGDLYAEIARRSGDLLDSYHWIKSEATLRLDEPLEQIRSAATAAINEYEKVARARASAHQQTAELQKRVGEAIAEASRRRFDSVGEFTGTLAALRSLRGQTISLRDVRYTDPDALARLEESLKQESERIANRCVEFLNTPDALAPFRQALADQQGRLDAIRTTVDAKTANEHVAKVASDLELLIETISNLPIDDSTRRTQVVESISAIFATVNALRAEIRNRRRALAASEGAAEFGSQLKLLEQAVVNALDRCDAPDQCDHQLTRLLLQIEELEGRFAEFDAFAVALAEKRDEIAAAFETRKSSLLERRARRAGSLAAAADRLLSGIATRSKTFDAIEGIHGYFAGDLTVAKVRDLSAQLVELGDAARAEGLLTRLKATRDDAVRQLKDRKELYAEGPDVINFGGYRFRLNTQPVSLTTIVRDDRLMLHLTGTQYYEEPNDESLYESRDCWNLQHVSESPAVYRGEYLAWSLFHEEQANGGLARLRELDEPSLVQWVASQMAPRYAEGYLKGVHDRDAAAILQALLVIDESLGPLRPPPLPRALAAYAWWFGISERTRARLQTRVESLRELAAVWPQQINSSGLRQELEAAIASAAGENDRFHAIDAAAAAAFLIDQLIAGDRLAVSAHSIEIARNFHETLKRDGAAERFRKSIGAFDDDLPTRYEIARQWMAAHIAGSGASTDELLDEATVLLLTDDIDAAFHGIDASASADLTGMLGDHPTIKSGLYRFDYYRFFDTVGHHVREVEPRYRRYIERKLDAVERARDELRLDELRPQVMASFVRNRLIDTVYLPLIGANLAKQIGVAGEATRVDRQGMLLLISPPGYGKTTLMEYIADRLGLMFLKINGPAIGYTVTSLDPAAAPNLAAREELTRLGFGLEAGDNVMIYVDDIQHCHSEFLQKFISLCDAQRKIEGVWRGEAKTYDLRGRKVAVVMAGNPYTESGEMFRIPDMLANRADVYNLGDISGRHREAFELSFLENALTSNAHLARLAENSSDAVAAVDLAQGADPSAVTLEGTYDPAELQSIVSVVRKLLRVRDIVLKVNAEYIRSAAQADEFREAPAFKLQGSYRNMNRIAEKILPAMNDDEVDELIATSYRNDAQTLTTGAEANLLRFRELVGWMSEDDVRRWKDIRETFRKNQLLRGVDQSDRLGQAISQLALFAEGLAELRDTLSGGIERLVDRSRDDQLDEAGFVAPLRTIGQTLSTLEASLQEGFARVLGDGDRQAQLTIAPEVVQQVLDGLRTVGHNGRDSDSDDDRAGPTDRANTPAVVTVPAGTAPSGAVTIVNKIPSTLLNVLREQFRLMETWLRPLLDASHRQSAEYEDLSRQIRVCLKDYEKLVGRIEASQQNRPD